MGILKELFTSGPGLMSAIGLLIMFGIGGFFFRFGLKHMRDDEAKAKAAERQKG